MSGKAGIAVAAVIGFLAALAWVYYRQAKALYDDRNLITSGGNLVSAAQDFASQVRQKL